MGIIIILTAIFVEVIKADVATPTIQIHPGSKVTPVLGSNLTLNCTGMLSRHDNVTGATLRWHFSDQALTSCRFEPSNNEGNEAWQTFSCSVTITPILRSSEGKYKCTLFDGEQFHHRDLQLTVSVPSPTVDMTDKSTGDTVNAHSGIICVPRGDRRTFECTVRDASSGAWRITWLDSRDVIKTGGSSEHAAVNTDGMVNISSEYTVINRPDGRLIESLTCRALGPTGELLTVAVKLQSCTVPSGSGVYVVVAVVSVLATLMTVGALLCAIRLRRPTQTQQAGIQHVDVTASEPPPQVALISRKTEATRNQPYEDIPPDTGPEYEHRIAADALHQYEGRITEEDPGSTGAEDGGNLSSWAEKWQIPWRDLEVYDRVLGTGEFGEVRLGAVKVDGEIKKSAVKMLKGHASPTERDDFLAELQTMTSIGSHPHIVSLIGACQQDVLYVALEYLSNGDLRSFLRTARAQSDTDEGALSRQQLLTFALDVAKGMEYLAAKGVIHRDLAARNILLGDGLVAKVSDFGLSRGEDLYVQTSNKRVPIRWLAIESMAFQTYTTQSDVWSFGILLWEITTIGGTPYPSIKSEALESKLSRGYRMPKPNNCDDKTYALMRRCWKEDSKKRPTFDELVSILSEMTDTRIKHTYMSTYRVQYENLSAIRPEFDDN